MAEVQARLPQRRTRQRIQVRRERAGGKTRPRQRHRALEHPGEVGLLRVGGRADRPDAGDVGGAAQVLCAGVDQQQALGHQPVGRGDLGEGLGRGAVVRHRAVGVEAGDGRKAQADEAVLAGALGRQALVDGQLADRLAAECGLQPGVEAAHRRAVLLHRLADEGGLGRRLAALGQRAGVDRLDHLHDGRHRLAQAQRDALRVDQQHRVGRQRRQRRGGLGIVGQVDAVGGQPRGQRLVDLARRHEQRRALRADQQVGQEDRVVVDIRAAQAGDPGDVVDGRDQMVAGAVAGQAGAHRRQPLGTRHRRVRRQMLAHRRGRQAGAFRPGLGHQVEVGAQADAVALQRAGQHLRRRQAQHRRVDRQRLAGRERGGQPVDGVRGRAGGDLHQLDRRAGQLGLGLRPVAAVGEDRGAVARDHQRAHRAGEAGKVSPALPALGQVFGEVRIAGGHQHRGQVMAHQRLAQRGQAGGNRGGRVGHVDVRAGSSGVAGEMLEGLAVPSRRCRTIAMWLRSE